MDEDVTEADGEKLVLRTTKAVGSANGVSRCFHPTTTALLSPYTHSIVTVSPACTPSMVDK